MKTCCRGAKREEARIYLFFIYRLAGYRSSLRCNHAPWDMQLKSCRLHPFLGFGRRVLSFVAPYVDLKSALQSAAYPPAEKPKGDDYKPGYYITPAAAAGGSGTSREENITNITSGIMAREEGREGLAGVRLLLLSLYLQICLGSITLEFREW